MYSKIKISGKIRIITGVHIGGSKEFSAIGAVDSPIIKDPKTGLPIIPGSSLKGKMRTLLAKVKDDDFKAVKDYNQDNIEVLRLFGSSNDKNEKNQVLVSRLQFTDSFINSDCYNELRENDIMPTEVKYENNIDRITSIANPRQIERIIRNSVYDFILYYDADTKNEIVEDMKNIKLGLNLLESDYIGGNGSRGYGRIKFEDLHLNCITENKPENLEEITKIIQG